MQKLYFLIIVLVFVISLLVAIMIWVQTGRIGAKALAEKQAKEKYLQQQLMLEQEKGEDLAESRLQDKQSNQTRGNPKE